MPPTSASTGRPAAKALVSDYLETIRAAAPADPEHPVLAPGDRAHAVRSQSLKRGMFIDDGLWADLEKLAQEANQEPRHTRKEKHS